MKKKKQFSYCLRRFNKGNWNSIWNCAIKLNTRLHSTTEQQQRQQQNITNIQTFETKQPIAAIIQTLQDYNGKITEEN